MADTVASDYGIQTISIDDTIQSAVCVVISYWNQHDIRTLTDLLRGMERHPAGVAFDLVIVCNGGGLTVDRLPPLRGVGSVTVVNRENSGYNIGAWDAGFRARPDYRHYLFLQSECFIRQPGWLEAFVFRIENDPGLGVLGEGLMWDGLSWDFIKLSTARDLGPDWYAPATTNPIDFYRAELDRMGIPQGPVGTHVQSLVVFLAGDTLRTIDGFPNDSRYQHAVACEIAISRKIAALGLRVELLKPLTPFAMIGHPEWSGAGLAKARLRRATLGRIRQWLRPLRRMLRPG